MQTATHTLQKSPKVKKIEDIVKPDATMRLHQRLFDRRRKHHIDIKEEASPGVSLSAYLIDPKYRSEQDRPKRPEESLSTTTPVPVLQYSQITRSPSEVSYLEKEPRKARSFRERISQRYHVFVSQHKPFYYSLTNGVTSGWLQNPRSRVALAGSALALLAFFSGTPTMTPPTGPDNPTGHNPIVIQDTSKGIPDSTTEQQQSANPGSTQTQALSPNAVPRSTPQPIMATNPTEDITPSPTLINRGGYGSGPASNTSNPGSTATNQTSTPAPDPASPNLIQDIIKPTPVTIPGQDIKLDDKQILKTTDTTITIN